MSPKLAEAVAAAEKFPADQQDLLADSLLDRLRTLSPFSPAERAKRMAELLEKWRADAEPGEAEESFDALVRGLNETRAAAGARLHFPPELKGKTW